MLAAARLLLAVVFAVALTMSLGCTMTLIKDVIESRGDREAFEAGMRHYFDRLEWAPDGSLVMHRQEHPVAMFFAIFAGSVVATLASGYGFQRLGSSRRGQATLAS